MTPIYSSVSNLEKMASSKEPSSEGSWWITLQTTENIINRAVYRDPVSNAVLDGFWNDLSIRLTPTLLKGGVRPLPYDDIMQLVDYCGEQLSNIIANPRHKLIKVDKMVSPYRVQRTSPKTMNWLGKQPGKTIKEKLASKNKMLTQANEYSYDVKENQVVILVLKQLLKKVQERIEFGIELDGYDENSEKLNIDKLNKMKKALKKSNLCNVKPTHHNQPNNVLLGDKSYSVVWRAYQKIAKYESNMQYKWKQGFNRYVMSLFISLVAKLASFNEIQLIEERILIREDDGEICLLLKEKENCKAEFIINCESQNPIGLTVSLFENKINISLKNIPINKQKTNSNSIDACLLQLNYENYDKKLEPKRGIPIKGRLLSGYAETSIDVFADMEGLSVLIDIIVATIEKNVNISFADKLSEYTYIKGTCTFDFAGNKPFLTVNNEHVDYDISNYVVSYLDNSGEEVIYRPVNNNYYKGIKNIYYVKDAVTEEKQTQALKNVLEDIAKRVTLGTDDYFIYTVPDALEEFSQKSLKQSINLWFPKSFPVWRSVAALTNVLMSKDIKHSENDLFLSVDLTGEAATAGLLTINYDNRVKGFVCNHFPPFPQEDLGEYITEKYFARLYLEKYFKKHKILINEELIKQIVDSGKLENLLNHKLAVNEILLEEDVQIIRIVYEEDVIQRCINEWLDNFNDFINELKANIPRNKFINYTLVLSDTILKQVGDRVNDSLAKNNAYVATLFVDNEKISNGAYQYKDRIIKYLPTWTEYLPKLSLEVIKEGKFDTLELVNDNVSYDVMGEHNELVVKEKLVLKAGEQEYRFPLIKEDISRKAAMIEAYVKDKSFPLIESVNVELIVRYKYGYDNSYELILRPFQIEKPPFEEIIVEWTETHEESSVNIWPGKTNTLPEEIVLRAIEETKSSLQKIENSILFHMVNYQGNQDKSIPIKNTTRFLSTNIFKIRNIVLSEIPEAKEFINWFKNIDLYKYLGQISGLFRNDKIPDSFFDENAGRELDFLKGDSMQVLFSIGVYTPDVIQEYFVKNYNNFSSRYRMKAMLDMLLKNYMNKEAVIALIKEIRDSEDEDTYSIKMDGFIRELSKMCCFDSELIYLFYFTDGEFISEIVRYVLKGLYKMHNKCKKIGVNYVADKKTIKRYLAYLETILSVLRLRDINRVKNFGLLSVNSIDSKRLANNIRKLDGYMGHPKSRVRFKLDKPENLYSLSDLSYAIDLYLTGNKKAATIEVVSIDDED